MPFSDLQAFLPFILTGVLAFAAGAFVVYALSRRTQTELVSRNTALQAQIKGDEKIEQERVAALTQAEQRLAASFSKLANDSLTHSSETFLRLAKESLGKHQEQSKSSLLERQQAIEEMIKPIQKALEKTHHQIGEIEKDRRESFGSLKTQLELMNVEQKALQTHTRNLVTALRRPEVRGQWGELTLKRIAELAGMVEHCDFFEQTQVDTPDGTFRPDMIIRLPDRGEIVVDVKTPLDAYLQAVEASDDESRKAALQRHARNVTERIRELSTKAYWAQFKASPEFVILFIPGDQFLSAALSENPNLLEDALRQKVILATPTSLVALLKAIAYGWRQIALADNAEEIRQLAQDLHGRLSVFTSHLARLGKQLDSSVKAYNSAVGSLERSVLPGARKFIEMGVMTKKPIESLTEIETMTRSVEDQSEETANSTTEALPPDADGATTPH
jgi:DNA recombination protein RmuC